MKSLKLLLRHILLGSFWSFLLVLSGLVDIGAGLVLVFTGALSGGEPPVPVYVICLATGAVYLALGVVVGVVTMKRRAS